MPAIAVTHTRTHLTITPANPFLACSQCGRRAERFHDPACGCEPLEYPEFARPVNFPCGHHADYDDLCPSWGPVDGCQCLEHLGTVPHPAVLPAA